MARGLNVDSLLRTGGKQVPVGRIAILLVLCVPAVCAAVAPKGTRPPTVADSIEMRRLVDPDPDWNGRFKISPDRAHVLVVTMKGNLESGENDYFLQVYDLQVCLDFLDGGVARPKPRTLAVFSSKSNRPAIRGAKWIEDGRRITFLGGLHDAYPQLYSVSVNGNDIEKLTDAPGGVWSYDINPQTLIYTTRIKIIDSSIDDKRRRGFTLTSENFMMLSAISNGVALDLRPLYTTILRNRSNEEERSTDETPALLSEETLGVWLSGNGTKAVGLRPVNTFRPEWLYYRHPRAFRRVNLTDTDVKSVPIFGIFQFVLIDVESGTVRPLLDAPSGRYVDVNTPTAALWSQDSDKLVLVNTLLPLKQSNPDDASESAMRAAVAEVDLVTGSTSVILPLKSLWESRNFQRVSAVNWATSDKTSLEVKTANVDGPLPDTYFERKGDKWLQVDLTRRLPHTFKAKWKVAESLNKAPEIFLEDASRTRKVQISELNPQFDEISFQDAEIYQWIDKRGKRWRGGLLLPRGYRAGIKYPLIIQTHGFWPKKFFLDGSHTLTGGAFTTASAAQALAAKGMVVLQMEDHFIDRYRTTEARTHMEGIEAAVKALVRKGLVDKDRVGLSGFSRSGYYVAYTIVHSKLHFKAALISDPVDRGYVSYLFHLHMFGGENTRHEYESMNGGFPFEKSAFIKWSKNLPTFNVDDVRTPVRLETIGWRSLLAQWEFYAGLKLTGKTVEMTYFPIGSHILVRPWERKTSQQGAVDWFNYWMIEEN